MRVLVLGGNGFIGSHLLDKLINLDWEIVVYDRVKEGYRRELKGVRYVYGEFDDRRKIAKVLKGIDVVFHLIWTTIPKTSNDNPIFDVQSNVLSTIALLEECIKANIKKFIFMSSGGTVYGIPQTNPIKETHPTNPICSYGITKLCIEKYIMLFQRMQGLNYSIIRASNPFGERQNPLNAQGFVTVLLYKTVLGQPVTIWGDGNVVRDFFYVGDLAKALSTIAINNAPSGIYNIGSSKGISLNRMIEIIKETTGIAPMIIYKKPRNFDIPKVILDISKAKIKLGWFPETSLEAGIEKTYNWLQQLSKNIKKWK